MLKCFDSLMDDSHNSFLCQDRSLGLGPLPNYGYDWPLNFCARYVFWCGYFLDIFHVEYVGLLRDLAEFYVKKGHFSSDLSLLQNVTMQLGGGNATDEILTWMGLRIAFLFNSTTK